MEETFHNHVIYTFVTGLEEKLIPQRIATCILVLHVFGWVEFFQLRYIFLDTNSIVLCSVLWKQFYA